ncbi:uncharacterized protein LOC101855651, partial [Aplysia californica]|uniref:Uncharacterized protein LOC101855651 n=1 Tax=Aplysia californica TaxID=6500 RepID=A0ABM1A363_APLCA
MKIGRWGNVSFSLQFYQSFVLGTVVLATVAAVTNYLSQTWKTPISHIRVDKYRRQKCHVQAHLRLKSLRDQGSDGDVSEDEGRCRVFPMLHQSNYSSPAEAAKTSCRRVQPVPGSCHVAQEVFFSQPPPSCSHQEHIKFCQVETKKKQVTCSAKIISSVCASPPFIGLHNQSGRLQWVQLGTASSLAQALTDLMRRGQFGNFSKHFGFCFLRCDRTAGNGRETTEDEYAGNGRETTEDEYVPLADDLYDKNFGSDQEKAPSAEQLLILPPLVKTSSSRARPVNKSLINFNLVLVDSVSRQHFFRSLNKSVLALENLNRDFSSPVAVFDFELVQSVKSRTFESLQTLFSGDIDPSRNPFGTQEVPPEPLDLSLLLGKLKDKGYSNLWLEDLCHLWEWGLSKDLHFLNLTSPEQETWTRMWTRLAENFVDSIEVTLAMCRVFESCGVKDGFHGPEAICYNGRHQHEYLLDYLAGYQHTLTSANRPWFSFTMTNVGHEETGRRIQTLDLALSHYISAASAQANTLTILFSDHGNSYGRFVSESTEAQVEMFHPFLFFIVPRQVGRQLGVRAMRSLGVNSRRLVSLLDVHYTLTHLISPGWKVRERNKDYAVTEKGLLEPVGSARSCNDLALIPPNVCICEDFEREVSDHSGQELLAYFAVDQLNAEIQRQFAESHTRKGTTLNDTWAVQTAFGNCERLSLIGYRNVKTSFDKHRATVVKMDVLVQKSARFFVTMTIREEEDGRETVCEGRVTTDKFDRLTRYGQYASCADGVDLSLCLCQVPKSASPRRESTHGASPRREST